MMTICLIFWFFSISASVTAVSIYLIKKIDIESRKRDPEGKGFVGSTDSSQRVFEAIPEESAYEEYNILGFLLDAMYVGDEQGSRNRSHEASPEKGKHEHRKPTVKSTLTTDYDYPETEARVGNATDYDDDYYYDETTVSEPSPDMDYSNVSGAAEQYDDGTTESLVPDKKYSDGNTGTEVESASEQTVTEITVAEQNSDRNNQSKEE